MSVIQVYIGFRIFKKKSFQDMVLIDFWKVVELFVIGAFVH